MPHDDEARDRMLRAVYSYQPLVLGLARDSVDDEERDPAYERVPLQMSTPQTAEDGRIFVANAGDVQFPPYAADAERAVKFWLLFDGAGVRLAYDRIRRPGSEQPRPVLPAQGEAPLFAAGELKVGLR